MPSDFVGPSLYINVDFVYGHETFLGVAPTIRPARKGSTRLATALEFRRFNVAALSAAVETRDLRVLRVRRSLVVRRVLPLHRCEPLR